MDLTNKINYLLTEYKANVQPMIQSITKYAGVLNAMKAAAASPEALLIVEATIAALTPKLLLMAQGVEAKAKQLLITNDDHVSGMAGNVEDDAQISGLSAQVSSLKTTIIGMGAIVPNGAPGAAAIVSANLPTIADLATLTSDKTAQIQQATSQISALPDSVNELSNFSELIANLS